MSKPIIGGDFWRKTLQNFVAQFGRRPTGKELKVIKRAFNCPRVKTKGRATDYQCKGATTSTCYHSAALRNVSGSLPTFDDTSKVARQVDKPLTAR